MANTETKTTIHLPLRLKYKILKYFEIAKINYLQNATYLIHMVSRSAIVVIRIWIFTSLYIVTYRTLGQQEINGLSITMVVWGLALTQSFQSASKPPVSKMIDDEVKSGSLAYSLNRPYSYILFHYFGYMGRVFSGLISNVILGSLACLVLVGIIDFSPLAIIMGTIILFFGYLLDFIIQIIIGLFAFWTEDVAPFRWIYEKSQLVLGGVIMPLALFPDNIRGIAEILPFGQLYYSAARLMVNFDIGLFEKFILAQLAWIVFFGALASYLFNKSTKYVSINGG